MLRLCAMLLLCLPVSAWAGGTTLVQQGRLFDVAGSPNEGTHDVTFTIYESGVEAWSEVDPVEFTGGYYATVLGDTNPTLHDLDFANGTYTLGITVGTAPELTPRTPLTSVVSALRGPINISDDGVETPCTSAAEGTLRYRQGVQVCNGTSWTAVGAAPSGTCVPGTQAFQYSGAAASFTMPAGCSTLAVEAWGAGGGGGYASNGTTHHGGAGGYMRATFDTSPGTVYTVVVGQGGIRNTQFGSGGDQAAFGFAGAPYGHSTPCAVGGGGGLSGLFVGQANPSNAVLIAGGGGGASGYTFGGSGNDTTNGGGQISLDGQAGDSVWEGGGGGGYSGGSLHVRQTNDSRYAAGEGGTGYITLDGVQPETVLLEAAPFGTQAPPGRTSPNYSGVGTTGDAAIGYGGLGGPYGVNCDASGDGLVVVSYSE